MKIKLEQKNLFCLPWTQTILGTHLHGRVNFMALAWLTRVNIHPPMLGICVNPHNASHGAIVETGMFSINVPDEDTVAETDYTGLVSGRKIDKSALFEVFYGELDAAPMIARCPLTMECRLYRRVDLPSHTLFIAEMVNIYTEERFLTDGKPDMGKIRPFLLSMPENAYWSLGSRLGNAWDSGKKLRKETEGS